MSNFNDLLLFENKNRKIFIFSINNYPIYLLVREKFYNYYFNYKSSDKIKFSDVDFKFSLIRLIFSIFKLFLLKKKINHLLITSTYFRRDNNENLYLNFIKENHKDTIIFEWQKGGINLFSFLTDKYRKDIVPLDFISFLFKLYKVLYFTKLRKLYEKQKKYYTQELINNKSLNNDNIDKMQFIVVQLAQEYINLYIKQKVVSYFIKSKTIKNVYDLNGHSFSYFIPIMKIKPKLTFEFQHGVISSNSFYNLPEFVNYKKFDYFNRNWLLFDNYSKQQLLDMNIYNKNKLIVIGNIRIKNYLNRNQLRRTDQRNLILFTSQPFYNVDYYNSISVILKSIKKFMKADSFYNSLKLVIKLHPREINRLNFYKKLFDNIQIYDYNSNVFDLLNRSYLNITFNSTVIIDATYFNTPTIVLDPNCNLFYKTDKLIYINEKNFTEILNNLKNIYFYKEYIQCLKNYFQ